jgi:hypothetical protein
VEGLDVDGKIILKWILYKYGGKVWTGFFWLRIEMLIGSYEYTLLKCSEFLD